MSRFKSLKVALVSSCLVAIFAVSAWALPCLISSRSCSGSYDVQVYNDIPTTVCPAGDTVYELTFTVSCSGSSFSDSDLVCGSLSNSVSFYDSATGITHTFTPRKGKTWSDGCGSIGYRSN
ncbi:MAG: hypothetical protein HKN21_07410 [Candidatus Eisenbacteria bacterium]|uniref:Uncharacterized protein n=1 Tax=Eiseniibacteriota bacterium TaxID=2212470 RepID=A0A7Y2E931_UNCEI|nr:hypothetical protein [Candidatus Eisenbacteria bacterium]